MAAPAWINCWRTARISAPAGGRARLDDDQGCRQRPQAGNQRRYDFGVKLVEHIGHGDEVGFFDLTDIDAHIG
jgi:hypothetical protein